MLVVDTGNVLFGKDPSNSSQGAIQIQAMNGMGYDAMAFGEIDLAVPAAVLRERFQEAEFAALSANLQPADQLPLQPYTLKEIDGHVAAIIGATAPRAAGRAKTVGLDLKVGDPLQTISQTVAGLRDQADVIIVLSNLSASENTALAQKVPGIDIILGAHDATAKFGARAENGPDGKVIVALTYRQGQYLGVLTARFDDAGHVVSYTNQDVALTDKFADDPAMLELLGRYGVKPQ